METEPSDDVATAGFVAAGRKVLLHVVNLRAEARDVVVRMEEATGLAQAPLKITGRVMGEGSRAEGAKGAVRVHLAPNSFARVMLRADK